MLAPDAHGFQGFLRCWATEWPSWAIRRPAENVERHWGVRRTWQHRVVAWPPRVGEPLPRAAHARYEEPKWSEWILSARGHGREWEAIFHVRAADANVLWDAIAKAVVEAPVYGVRVSPGGGMLSEVRFELVLQGRNALAITVWHLARDGAVPSS